MRNLAIGVITLFLQNIVTLAQTLEIKCAKQFFHLGTSDGIVSHLKMAQRRADRGTNKEVAKVRLKKVLEG